MALGGLKRPIKLVGGDQKLVSSEAFVHRGKTWALKEKTSLYRGEGLAGRFKEKETVGGGLTRKGKAAVAGAGAAGAGVAYNKKIKKNALSAFGIEH